MTLGATLVHENHLLGNELSYLSGKDLQIDLDGRWPSGFGVEKFILRLLLQITDSLFWYAILEMCIDATV